VEVVKTGTSVLRSVLIAEARALRSEHGENPEYDRALYELVYWAAGGDSLEAVRKEVLNK
jgi:hypothetical protein